MGDGIHTTMGYTCSDCGKVFLMGYKVFQVFKNNETYKYNICEGCKIFYKEKYFILKKLLY